MHHYEYQFNNGIGAERKRFQRRLRLALLFVLIAALTAGIIYLIVPGEKKLPQVGGEQEKAAENTSPAEKTAQKTPGENVVNTAADPEKTLENNSAGVVENAENSGNEAVAGNPADNTSAPAPTREPQKGKPWIGDPVNDVPPTVENKSSSAVALEELKASFEARNYASAAAKALEMISSENEGSPVYRTAAEYLRRSRMESLSSGAGVSGISYQYVIRSGDTLSRIARRNGTTVQALMNSNHLENGLIRIGNRLTVTPGPWKVVVSKSNRLLKLHQGREGRLFCVFDVGVGRGNSTPKGEFVISTRLKDPKWYAPDGRIYEPGEEGNELGKYFLKLAAAGNPDRPLLGYGIHGTPDENTVGNSVSSGCIRMRSADIEMLYKLVPERTPVVITD